MDNKHLDIRSEGQTALNLAIALAFTGKHRNHTATAWKVDPKQGLIFYWHPYPTTHPLPFEMTAAQAAEFAWNWLEQVADKDRKERGDHDGSNGKGFRVHATDWGHVEDEEYSICAVQAIWAWYGK